MLPGPFEEVEEEFEFELLLLLNLLLRLHAATISTNAMIQGKCFMDFIGVPSSENQMAVAFYAMLHARVKFLTISRRVHVSPRYDSCYSGNRHPLHIEFKKPAHFSRIKRFLCLHQKVSRRRCRFWPVCSCWLRAVANRRAIPTPTQI